MKYFHPLYDYLGRYHFTIYVYFVSAIKNILASKKYDHICFYDYRFDFFINTSTTIENLFFHFLPNIGYKKIDHQPQEGRNEIRSFSRLVRGLKRPVEVSHILRKRLSREKTIRSFRKIDPSRKTILVSEPLAELSFLLDESFMTKYNIIYFKENDSCFQRGELPRIPKMELAPPVLKHDFGDYTPYANIFLKDICHDISNNISDYIGSVKSLLEINKSHSIDLAIWGSDPSFGQKALRNECLRSIGVKVLGAQHGGLYAETANMQYEASFERCDYFVGYGYSEEDLKRLYPDKELKTKILPFGKVIFTNSRKKRKKIDILFPITNTISIFEGGMHRFPPDRLTRRQTLILEYLNTLTSHTVYVKPFSNVSYSNLSVFATMKRLRNLHICTDLSLGEFLERYNPRMVIIELPSQPLYEILHLDTEIFLLGDTVLPWDDLALNELKKRVHYAEDTKEILDKIDDFLNNKLEKSRDPAYFQHYVSKKDTEKNILRFIDQVTLNAN
jgi:hypothetical protein